MEQGRRGGKGERKEKEEKEEKEENLARLGSMEKYERKIQLDSLPEKKKGGEGRGEGNEGRDVWIFVCYVVFTNRQLIKLIE